MKKIRFTFWEGSVEGLDRCVTLMAYNDADAKRHVLKWIATNMTWKHESEDKKAVDGVYPDCLEIT